MKLSKSPVASVRDTNCQKNQTVKNWRSNRGYMFALMLAMLALMAAMGVGLSRLLMTTKATTQMQRMQDNKQILNSVVLTLSTKAVDSDGDNVLEAPGFSTTLIPGFIAPTGGGFVDTNVANTDAWGRRLGYCAYDYGSTATSQVGKGWIRGSSASVPTDSWVTIVAISAGPDGVIKTPCPPKDTAASDVVALGDDMVAARSYGEMVSFGNAQIASALSGFGTNKKNMLCRLGIDGKMVCDIPTSLSNKNTANQFCRIDGNGALLCDVGYTGCPYGQASVFDGMQWQCTDTILAGEIPACGNNQASKWNGGSFDCVDIVAPGGGPGGGPQCATISFSGARVTTKGYDWSCEQGAANQGIAANSIYCDCSGNKTEKKNNTCGDYNASGPDQGWKCWPTQCRGTVCN